MPDTVEHLERVISELPSPPTLIGHASAARSSRSCSTAASARPASRSTSVPTEGVGPCRVGARPCSRCCTTPPTAIARSVHAQAVPPGVHHYAREAESQAVYDRYHIPAPGGWVWDGVLANITPGHRTRGSTTPSPTAHRCSSSPGARTTRARGGQQAELRALPALGVLLVDLRGHDLVLAPGDEEQRCAVGLGVVDPRVRVAGRDVGERAVPDPSARGGDVVAVVDRLRLGLVERGGERPVELLGREADRAMAVAGLCSTGNTDRSTDRVMAPTPSVGTDAIAMPAAPKPRSSRIWTSVPPKPWPISVGGLGSSEMTRSRCSTVSGTVTASIGEGSSRRASTSPSRPG